MTPFLKDLAETFYSLHGKRLKDFCFVTPNKRSGTFLLNHFSNAFAASARSADDVFVAPHIVTISDFVADLSGKVVNTRLDNLFTLFRLYSRRPNARTDFDRFRTWGDIALSDFNDVDMYCVNSDKLFRNLANVNEIETDFLTDEQREVVETYFPSGASRNSSGSFWKHFNNKSSDTADSFLHLWEVMHDLYEELNDDLDRRGLCTSGGAYRLALRRLQNEGRTLLPYSQVVFVGFNALTTVEYNIFRTVAGFTTKTGRDSESLADFYWDAAGDILNSDNYAARFMVANRKNFHTKHPLRASSAVTGFPRKITVISCPGNTLQTKVVSDLLREIHASDPRATKEADRVVVAMPDENLFFPMLYSLPSELEEVNITMGYPLKITSTFSWMRLLRTLHSHSRMENGMVVFLRQDLLPVLTHPLTRVMLGGGVSQWMCECLGADKSFTITWGVLLNYLKCSHITDAARRREKLACLQKQKSAGCMEAFEAIFYPMTVIETPEELCRHLLRLLSLARNAIAVDVDAASEAMIKTVVETDNIDTYSDAVVQFMEALKRHNISMNQSSVFALINRLLSQERITLHGEPLVGVQIMGMLETRSLDFETVIITSMNERVFPRRLRNRSFIPNSLRNEYGMATTRFQESIFAYYFYRMISRARRLFLIYDSRSSGVRSGDPSRYIYQLRYLYPHKTDIEFRTKRISVTTGVPMQLQGERTPEVKAILREFLTPGGRHLSASALKKYLTCPLQFYLHSIKKLYIKEEQTEALTAAEQGTVFHDAMHALYTSAVPSGDASVTVTADMIDSWLAPGPDGYSQAGHMLRMQLLKHYPDVKEYEGNMDGFAGLYFTPLYKYMCDILESDRRAAPFEFIGGEEEMRTTFPLEGGNAVNFKYYIDRIDRVGGRLRLVDYKTGSDVTTFRDMKAIFADRSHAAFQLLLYASLYQRRQSIDEPIAIGIAKPTTVAVSDYSYQVMLGGRPLDSHLLVKEEFEKQLREILNSIFFSEEPFAPCSSRGSDSGPCPFCDYRCLCNMKKSNNMLHNTSSD